MSGNEECGEQDGSRTIETRKEGRREAAATVGQVSGEGKRDPGPHEFRQYPENGDPGVLVDDVPQQDRVADDAEDLDPGDERHLEPTVDIREAPTRTDQRQVHDREPDDE
jgi:hypothetical protein